MQSSLKPASKKGGKGKQMNEIFQIFGEQEQKNSENVDM